MVACVAVIVPAVLFCLSVLTGGYLGGGVPHPGPGYPPSAQTRPGWGYSTHVQGTPISPDLDGEYPRPGCGYPSRTGTPGRDMGPVTGVHPGKDMVSVDRRFYGMETGYPHWCELTNKLKLVPIPILRMWAVKILCQQFREWMLVSNYM